MILSPLPFQTTAAPAERGERRERPERSAMKAGRTVGRNALEDPAGVAPCRAGLIGERRPPRNGRRPTTSRASAVTFGEPVQYTAPKPQRPSRPQTTRHRPAGETWTRQGRTRDSAGRTNLTYNHL